MITEKDIIVKVYTIVGQTKETMHDYKAALKFYQNAVKFAEKSQRPESLALAYTRLGGLRHFLGQYATAVKINEKALTYREQLGDVFGMFSAVNSLGLAYADGNDLESSIECHKKGLELAKKMGPTMAVDVRSEKIEDAVRKLGMKEGFDVGLEMSGSPDAFKSMLSNMCHGGKIALLGIMPETSIDWDYVVFNGLTIKGIYGRKMYETWYKVTMLIQKGLDITPLITHRFHYTEYAKAFEVMASGKTGKVILDWAKE